MSVMNFDMETCTLCGLCVDQCPFGALAIEDGQIILGSGCRVCGACQKLCPAGSVTVAELADTFRKEDWKDFLILAEQTAGKVHPVVLELLGETRKLAPRVDWQVNCVLAGGPGTANNAQTLLRYGADIVYVYEDAGLADFRPDAYTRVLADLIGEVRPGAVLIGGTALGRSLAPRLAIRFRTGLTADCTALDIQASTDLVQIRPAFGGDIMAQIAIERSRPQFATVRYRVLDRAKPMEAPTGKIVLRPVSAELVQSRIQVLSSQVIQKTKSIEEEEILVVAGRGARNEGGVELCRQLARALGGQLAFTRPMVESGFGDPEHQIGLSGRTVRPRLIITCGVSGAIQFTTCMSGADCIVAINTDPEARIFTQAHYCIQDDLFAVVPALTRLVTEGKED